MRFPRLHQNFHRRSHLNMAEILPSSNELSVDESMIPCKGRSSLLPAISTKWGIKAYGQSSSRIGYQICRCASFIVCLVINMRYRTSMLKITTSVQIESLKFFNVHNELSVICQDHSVTIS